MYRQKSLSKLSSRSLSQIKNKIQLAFSKPHQPQKQPQPNHNAMGSRSKSVKSLAKSKCDASENGIPFAVALKTGLIQTDRKSKQPSLAHPCRKQLPQSSSYNAKNPHILQQNPYIKCQRLIQNESVKGFSWYSRQGKEIVSQFKKGDGKLLRYFAIKEGKEGRGVLKVIAAIEQDIVYVGDKRYILVKSNKVGIIRQDETSKANLKDHDFFLLACGALLQFCNINRVIADIYALFRDGLNDLDVVTSIISRKIAELHCRSEKKGVEDVSFLLLLVQNRLCKYQQSKQLMAEPAKLS